MRRAATSACTSSRPRPVGRGTADGDDRWATTWYEPHRDPSAVAEGIRFALSMPGVHAICTPGDLGLLPVALDACEPRSRRWTTASRDDGGRRGRAPGGAAEIFPIPR